MSLFDTMNIGLQGLGAQRLRLEVSASNLANINTTRTAEGEAYRRKDVVFRETDIKSDFQKQLDANIKGVEAYKIAESRDPFIMRYEPHHPDADENGYVAYPNINLASEMVNIMSATRSYEANLSLVNSSKKIAVELLDLLKI